MYVIINCLIFFIITLFFIFNYNNLCFRQNRKKMKNLEKIIKTGQYDLVKNAYEIFLRSTSIKYCNYCDTQRILGSTYGMCIIQVSFVK